MVCTVEGGRMACMVRLLGDGGFSENSEADKATHEGIDVQTFYRQFYDADEPNLLEEKDMLVFDSRPLTDPLHLIRCNACEKPVRASQFAAHAERCRSIYRNGVTAVEPDGGTNRKKPPKKGRKKSQTTNSGSEEQKSEPAARIDVTGSDSNLDNQNGMLHALSGDAQKMSGSVEDATKADASVARDGGLHNSVISDVRGPLATKTYHPQGSHPLRAALGHLYHQTSAKQPGNNCEELRQDKDMMFSQVQYLNKPLHEMHKEVVPQTKEDYHQLPAFQTTSKRTL